jgi:plasmid stabilization system protein ParE
VTSLFSDDYCADLRLARAAYRKRPGDAARRLVKQLAACVRHIEQNPDAGKKVINQADFPGGRMHLCGSWTIIYTVKANEDLLEFNALDHFVL